MLLASALRVHHRAGRCARAGCSSFPKRLHTSEDFARAFAAIRRHLAPGGILAFDIFVPSAYMLSRHPDERQHVGKFSHSLLGEISVEETIRYNPIAQVSHSDWYWSTVTEPEFRHTSVDMRQIYPQELPLLLQHNGFELDTRKNWVPVSGGGMMSV